MINNSTINILWQERHATAKLLKKLKRQKASAAKIDECSNRLSRLDNDIEQEQKERCRRFISNVGHVTQRIYKGVGKNGWKYLASCGLFVFALTQIKGVLLFKRVPEKPSLSTDQGVIPFVARPSKLPEELIGESLYQGMPVGQARKILLYSGWQVSFTHPRDKYPNCRNESICNLPETAWCVPSGLGNCGLKYHDVNGKNYT